MEEGGSTPLVDSTLYRQLINILLYLNNSRRDLSYIVSVVSRFMQETHELDWRVAKRIFHNVHGTREFGIHYSVDAHLDMVGFTDSY